MELEIEKMQEQREKAGLLPKEVDEKVGQKMVQDLLTEQVKELKKVTKKKKKELCSYKEFMRKKALFQKAS